MIVIKKIFKGCLIVVGAVLALFVTLVILMSSYSELTEQDVVNSPDYVEKIYDFCLPWYDIVDKKVIDYSNAHEAYTIYVYKIKFKSKWRVERMEKYFAKLEGEENAFERNFKVKHSGFSENSGWEMNIQSTFDHKKGSATATITYIASCDYGI